MTDLVLLHSLLTDATVWDRVTPALSGRHRLHVPAIPGFASAPPSGGPDVIDYADAIAQQLFDAQGLGPETAVMGNGLGAFVAVGLAVRHGHRFRQLVVVGGGMAFPANDRGAFRAMATAVRDGGMGAVVDVAVRRIFTEDYLQGHPDELAARRDVLLRTDPRAFVHACKALERLDLRDQVGDINNPTLVVVGTEDAATPPALAHGLAAALADARVEELLGVAHAPQLQNPGAFLRVVEPFLAMSN